jgi:hypothetical protein
MKIKYIKDAPNGPAGMIDDVSDFHGNILILTGYAELDNTIYFDDQSQFTLVTESRSLINPNQIFEPTEPTEPKPKTKSKAKATTKTDNE